MGAHVEHTFARGFILDEERLRKLVNLILIHVDPDKRGGLLQFVVFRGDAFSYTTADIGDVLSEDNADWRRITRLDIKTATVEPIELLLKLSSDGTILQIEGSDRDRVFVLFSDLREYLSEEVNRAVVAPDRTIKGVFTLIALAAIFWLFWDTGQSEWPQSYEAAYRARARRALASRNLEDKLNVIIAPYAAPPLDARLTHRSPWLVPTCLTVTVLLMLMLGNNFHHTIVAFVFPSNVFVFGAQKHRHDRRAKLISNILWTVAIGGTVSLVTGYIVWLVTRRT